MDDRGKICVICESVFFTKKGKGFSNRQTCSLECGRLLRKQSTKRHSDNNKEIIKERYRRWKSENKEKLNDYRNSRRKTPAGYIDRFMDRMKTITPDTDITRDFFIGKMTTCSITKREFCFDNKYDCYHNPLAPSIDRVDPREGYYQGNVQVVLSCINRMKNDMPNSDFLGLLEELTGGSKS